MLNKKFVWQKIRIGAYRFMQRILLGQPAGMVPWQWVKSVAGGYFRPSLQEHLESHLLVHEPCVDHYRFPERFSIQFRRSKAFDARHLYVFKQTWVSPHSGVAFVADGWLLEESAGSLEKVTGWGHIMPELLLPREILRDQEPMLVVPAAPFYHFMWEHLPAILQALKQFPDVKFLLPSPLPRFVKDVLEIVVGGGWQERAVFSKRLCKVPHLIVPQIETHSGFIHPSYPATLLEAIEPALEGELSGDDRIYVSRSIAPGRRMRHEAELESTLKAMGFKVLYLEKMPLREQFKAFRRASMVVAPHGAGLSHLFLCRPGTFVLECFPESYFNDCYARLAVQVGLRYDYLTCRPDPAWEGGAMPVDNILIRINEKLEQPVASLGERQ